MSEFKMDFLCAGFNKCGTSSLHSVLKRIPEIQLPYNKKETLFFSWYDNFSDPISMFQKRYFPDYGSYSSEMILGAVEPSFMKHAEEVRKYFGKDIKLIFMLRNPADAIWSLFKMRLRRVKGRGYTNLYLAEHGNVEKMFRRYLKRFVRIEKDSDFFYDRWLNTFLHYYPRNQMQFVLFEDYIQNYQHQMEELGRFLGFSTDHLPRPRKQNVGNQISRNYICAEINRKLCQYSIKARCRGTNEEVFLNQQVLPIIQTLTLKECPVVLSEGNRNMALDIFRNSIIRTERLIDLPLEKRWCE